MRGAPRRRPRLLLAVFGMVLFLVLYSLYGLTRVENEMEGRRTETPTRRSEKTQEVPWWRQRHPHLQPSPRIDLHVKEYSWKDNTTVVQYEKLDQATDAEWLSVLRHGTIVSIEPNFLSGASEKYGLLIEFNNPSEKGAKPKLYRAVAKPATNVMSPKWPNYTLPVVDFYKQTTMTEPRMVGISEQGTMEIAGFHLDRLLQLYRKPPVSGRVMLPEEFHEARKAHQPFADEKKRRKMLESMSSEERVEFLEEEKKAEEEIARLKSLGLYKPPSPPDFTKRSLSPWEALDAAGGVSATVVAWARETSVRPPNRDDGLRLTQRKAVFDPQSGAPLVSDYLIKHLGDVSDTIVFDFLVDDHDRIGTHNWLALGDQLMTWDSGLGWRHGPEGHYSRKSDCLDILCGMDLWKNSKKTERCQRICLFRESTVEKIRSMGPFAPPERRMGKLLDERMKSDPLWPHFEMQMYYNSKVDKYSNIVRFKQENFIQGFDKKVALFLEHVSSCEEQFGDSVYL